MVKKRIQPVRGVNTPSRGLIPNTAKKNLQRRVFRPEREFFLFFSALNAKKSTDFNEDAFVSHQSTKYDSLPAGDILVFGARSFAKTTTIKTATRC